jgi:hypothetical protein
LPRDCCNEAFCAPLAGDLDSILACALADDPALRYHSAAAFGDDIGRYLAGKPVRAHPPSRWYRANKFLSRHRVVVALTSIFLVALLLHWASRCGKPMPRIRRRAPQASRRSALNPHATCSFPYSRRPMRSFLGKNV